MRKTYTTPTLRTIELECADNMMATSITVDGDHSTNEQYSTGWNFDDAYADNDTDIEE